MKKPRHIGQRYRGLLSIYSHENIVTGVALAAAMFGKAKYVIISENVNRPMKIIQKKAPGLRRRPAKYGLMSLSLLPLHLQW